MCGLRDRNAIRREPLERNGLADDVRRSTEVGPTKIALGGRAREETADLIEHETLETDRVQQGFADVRPWDGTRSDGAGRAASAAATDHHPPARTPKAQE